MWPSFVTGDPCATAISAHNSFAGSVGCQNPLASSWPLRAPFKLNVVERSCALNRMLAELSAVHDQAVDDNAKCIRFRQTARIALWHGTDDTAVHVTCGFS